MASDTVTLFLAGDVMTGRGIDQILPHPVSPQLFEPYVDSALGYVDLAEVAHGRIAKPVDFAYIWGDALAELRRAAPDVRIINLETAITTSANAWVGKGIHYRMHPANVPCLTAAEIDCCVLANNHVLDWGYPGLEETLAVLRRAHIAAAGAGASIEQARAPAVLEVTGKGRVLVFAFAARSGGVTGEWAATTARSGISFLPELSAATVQSVAREIAAIKRSSDIAVASIHWDVNWGYAIPPQHVRFAHALIEQAGVDVIHGHSSHHPKGIEIYRGKPILYGCGDLLNDYEGISGYEQYRGDLALLYFVAMDLSTKQLSRLSMTPMQIRRFRLGAATAADARWLQQVIKRESSALGARVDTTDTARFELR